ncbi:MAG: large subunit ribosomal protein L23 [Candidatus Paceibacteria bacterium]|jgi:large subunit ribosomal protein L23
MSSIDRMYNVIKKPVITEKATSDTIQRNAYHFRVPVNANKVEIRQAVETLFEVKVLSVNTLRVGGKARRRGWRAGQAPNWKKAMVTLVEGNTIDVI